MKFKYHTLLIILAVLTLLSGCFDGDAFDITRAENQNDVYVAGMYYGTGDLQNHASYWKNGKLTVLDSSYSHATSIAIDGDDVYIAGAYDNDLKACYWKNGVQVDLTTPNSEANSICIYNNHVYVAGAYNLGSTAKACYWIDGVQQDDLTGNVGTSASHIYVSAGNIYIAGYYDTSPAKACRWYFNNAWNFTDLNVGTDNGSYANAIIGNALDVFVVGQYIGASGGQAFKWYNGTRTDLSNAPAPSNAKDIISVDGVYYIAGSYTDSGNLKAAYWKGWASLVRVDLSGGTDSAAFSISVAAGKVYAAGYYNPGGTGLACYWDDGTLKDLEGGDKADANAIGVVVK